MRRSLAVLVAVVLVVGACGGGDSVDVVAGTLTGPTITTLDADGADAPEQLAMTLGPISTETLIGVDPALLYLPPVEIRCVASALDSAEERVRSEILEAPDLLTEAARSVYVDAISTCVSASSLAAVLPGALLGGQRAASSVDGACVESLVSDDRFLEALYLGLPVNVDSLDVAMVAEGMVGCISFSEMLATTVEGGVGESTLGCVDEWFAVGDRGVKVLDGSLSDAVTQAVLVDCMTPDEAALLTS